jgi:hypothetical protein
MMGMPMAIPLLLWAIAVDTQRHPIRRHLQCGSMCDVVEDPWSVFNYAIGHHLAKYAICVHPDDLQGCLYQGANPLLVA